MARRKYVWEIGLANLRASYNKAHAGLQREEDDFNALVIEASNRPPSSGDLALADAIAAYDELEYALLLSLRT